MSTIVFWNNENNKDTMTEINTSMKQLDDVQKKTNEVFVNLEHENEVANNNINTMVGMLEKIDADVKLGNEINSTIMEKTKNAQVASADLNNVIATAKTSSDNLNLVLNKAETIKNELKSDTDLPKMQSQIQANTDNISVNTESIKNINGNIDVITANIKNINKDIQNNNDSIEANAKNVNDNSTTIKNLGDELQSLINDMKEAKEKIVKLEKKGVTTLWQGEAATLDDTIVLSDSVMNYDKFIVSFDTFGKRSSICDLKENRVVFNNVNLENNLDSSVMQMFEVELTRQSETTIKISFIKRVNSYGDIAVTSMKIVKIEGIVY